jgi:ribonuclease P protein component
MENQGFPKARRLLSAGDFEHVYAARQSVRDHWIVVHGAANELNHPRLGLAVSRRAGRAVARNRWKRLLREAFRLTQHRLPPIDMVCSPRAAEPPSLQQLLESLPTLAHRIHGQSTERRGADGNA